MAHSTHPITSMAALRRTIETDNDTFRWFTFLVSQPPVRSALIMDTAVEQQYRKLRSFTLFQRIALLLLLSLLAGFFMTKQVMFVIYGSAVLLLMISVKEKTKRAVAQIGIFLIAQDYERSDFGQKTLYQIGEFYARKYGIRSLVTAMTSADTLVRRVLFYIWIFGTIINPVSVKEFWLLCISGYFVIYFLIDTALVYDRIK